MSGVVLDVNEKFMKISFNPNARYEEIYLTGLEQQNYNLILNDFSYFQFNFKEKENQGKGYNRPYARYAFYPNPFEQKEEGLEEIFKWYKENEISFEEYSQALSESKPLFKNVPIRYDLSYRQYKQLYHPTAHFHFSLAENSRISTDKVFSPLSFTMMIINMYYLDAWTEYNEKKGTEFILEKCLKRELDKCSQIIDCNEENILYFCDLQSKLLSIIAILN